MALRFLLTALLLPLVGASAATQPAKPHAELDDGPLPAFQVELLELAFRAGSAIPAEMDLKDRCKVQEAALAACLQLRQPARVVKHIGDIGDWRRGTLYADLAMYCARNGEPRNSGIIQKYLANAAEISKAAEDWRRDRIRVRIAQVHAFFGDTEKAGKFVAGVERSEQGKVHLTTRPTDAAAVGLHMRELEALAAKRDFDPLWNALKSAVEIHRLVYPEPERRAAVEKGIKAAMAAVPPFIRLDLLLAMAGTALEQKDLAGAKALVDEAQAVKDAHRWRAEDDLPLMARLAAAHFRAGNKERARKDLAAALALFNAKREEVLTTDRATVLLRIAEAYHAMGEGEQAIRVYKKALAEGAVNPNGRPRALDVAAACRSLALNAIEPDAELWAQIRATLAALAAPW